MRVGNSINRIPHIFQPLIFLIFSIDAQVGNRCKYNHYCDYSVGVIKRLKILNQICERLFRIVEKRKRFIII